MRHYETTFIIDPVLSGDEIKSTAQMYVNFLTDNGCEVIHTEEMGVLDLAYTIKKRTSGFYFYVEFKSESGTPIEKMELAFRRDDNIMRYLTVKVDKHRAQYNLDKRAGKFTKTEKAQEEAAN